MLIDKIDVSAKTNSEIVGRTVLILKTLADFINI